MTLTAKRSKRVRELIVVTNEHGEQGGVVYRWNEKHHVGARTNGHLGDKPSMADIRAAIAQVQS